MSSAPRAGGSSRPRAPRPGAPGRSTRPGSASRPRRCTRSTPTGTGAQRRRQQLGPRLRDLAALPARRGRRQGRLRATRPLPRLTSQTHALLREGHRRRRRGRLHHGRADFWAHGPAGDPGSDEPAVLYWLRATRRPDGQITLTPYLIHNDSGVGLHFAIGDINGDKAPGHRRRQQEGHLPVRADPAGVRLPVTTTGPEPDRRGGWSREGGSTTHVLNGRVVNEGKNVRLVDPVRPGAPPTPITCGASRSRSRRPRSSSGMSRSRTSGPRPGPGVERRRAAGESPGRLTRRSFRSDQRPDAGSDGLGALAPGRQRPADLDGGGPGQGGMSDSQAPRPALPYEGRIGR